MPSITTQSPGSRPDSMITELPLPLSGFDDFALNDVVRADHQHVAPFLARPDRVISRQQRLVLMPDRVPGRARRGPGSSALSLLSNTARTATRAGRGVDLRRDVVEMSFVRIAVLILQADLDRDGRKVLQVRGANRESTPWRCFSGSSEIAARSA